MKSTAARVWSFIKVVAPILIVVGVGWQFISILRRAELQTIEFACRWEWLIPGALCYLFAHIVFATFWVQLLHSQQSSIPWLFGQRAYFISQFGKYVPGKAWVIVMRVAMLRAFSPSRTIVALTATYETLTTMAGGAAVGVLLLPYLSQSETLSGREWMMGIIAAIPLGFGALHALIGWIARKYGRNMPSIPRLPTLLMIQGVLQSTIGWGLLGLSLWLTMNGLSQEPRPFEVNAWLRCTAIVSIAYVIGFLVLVAPGGVGVRELFMQQMLTVELQQLEGFSANEAAGLSVVIALVLRLSWTIAEMLTIFLLWRYVSPPPTPVGTPDE